MSPVSEIALEVELESCISFIQIPERQGRRCKLIHCQITIIVMLAPSSQRCHLMHDMKTKGECETWQTKIFYLFLCNTLWLLQQNDIDYKIRGCYGI